MKHLLYIAGSLLMLMLVAACSEDDIIVSNRETNWLVVSDNPTTELDRTRYEIFKSTGIPIYYNDTIGQEERTTLAGQPYTYYEVLQVFYNPGSATPSSKTSNYTLTKDMDATLGVVKFLRDDVFPSLSDKLYVPSVLLVDVLNSSSGTVAYKGLNTIVLSNVSSFSSMNEQARKAYRAAFLRAVVASSLMTKEEEWLEEHFFALTYAVNPDNQAYLYSTATIGYAVYKALSNFPVADQKLAALGFIGTRTKPTPGTAERLWYVPEKGQDVSQFCEAIFTYSEAEFKALHANESVTLAKYEVLRNKLLEYGFELN